MKPHISPRQMQVLKLAADGMSNKEMAAELGISIKTVEKHREMLHKSIDPGRAHSIVGTVVKAIRMGIIT